MGSEAIIEWPLAQAFGEVAELALGRFGALWL
jgi:hypothetical protein